MLWPVLALVLLALIVNLLVRRWRRTSDPAMETSDTDAETYDLDTVLAAARARGEERLARGEAAIREMIPRYLAADAAGRAAIRHSQSTDELYTLLSFADRAAVLAMRNRDRAQIDEALNALAIIELRRVDWPDLATVLAKVHHAARKIGVDSRKAFAAAAALAAPRTARAISDFLEENPPEKDLGRDWGFDDFEGEFIERGIEEYAPSRDLAKLARALADVFERDRYVIDTLTVAEELPATWLRPNEEKAESVLQSARGAASIDGRLADTPEQVLMAWLVELRESSQARRLLELSRGDAGRDFARLAVAHGSLFCLVVQRGQKGVETDQSLARFAAPIEKLLAP